MSTIILYGNLTTGPEDGYPFRIFVFPSTHPIVADIKTIISRSGDKFSGWSGDELEDSIHGKFLEKCYDEFITEDNLLTACRRADVEEVIECYYYC